MRTGLRTAAAGLVAIVAAGALAACGGDSDEEAIRDTVSRFADATADKDYQAICDDLIAEELSESVESVGLPCEAAFRRGLDSVEEPTLAIEDVEVNRRQALVRVRTGAKGQPESTDSLQLVLEGGDWRISALAQAQPPAPEPNAREQDDGHGHGDEDGHADEKDGDRR